MALPLPITPSDIGALTPSTRSEAEAAFAVRSQASPQSISVPDSAQAHPFYHIHTSSPNSPIDGQFNALYQTSSSGPPKPFVQHPEYPMQRRQSHNYLDAATEAGLPPSTCEPPYPTEETAEQVKGNLSRGTTQAVLQKMDSIIKTTSADGVVKEEHTHVTFVGSTAATSSGPLDTSALDMGGLNKRLAREGHRRTSSITVPVLTGLKESTNMTGGGEVLQKPSFDRAMSWKREDKKRALYQQEKLMEEERRFGKNYGYDSASEEDPKKYGQF
ncbi:hypothetical protein E2P81_ATG01239 [Venturia nashicola]|uniref:Uncharacterized protein n=1 Tax=Venturia nashicola TaxID=86259 RepID=A0A4Z1PL89_9PEZI|nr:hypothetical protein E6O75_ATG01269 [Venturia nashicola]TLD38696.1 hypothetical protein E2P81_ATG01239 [Venturia nashicola]